MYSGGRIFCKYCHLSWKRYEICPQLLWNTNRKWPIDTVWPKVAKFGMVAQVVHERVSRRSHTPVPRGRAQIPQIFGDPHLHSNCWTYSDEIWYDNTCGGSVFLGRQSCPYPNGVGPASPKNFVTYMHIERNNNHILHGDQTRFKEKFHMVDHECWYTICSQ